MLPELVTIMIATVLSTCMMVQVYLFSKFIAWWKDVQPLKRRRKK